MKSIQNMRTLAIAASLALLTSSALAQSDYPSRLLTFEIPQAVGGSTDLLARTIGQKLGEALGKSVIMDNKAGANGIIGTENSLRSGQELHAGRPVRLLHQCAGGASQLSGQNDRRCHQHGQGQAG